MLDNLEHLLDATPLAGELLAAAPGLTILATSRTHLNLYGESEYRRAAARPAPARCRCSRARAGAVRTSFALTTTTPARWRRSARGSTGCRSRSSSPRRRSGRCAPTEILARLERRLELLTGGPRDVPARQRTLRDTIVWSHDLLTPVEQRLFARLAVFSGGWSAEAADAVCCDAQTAARGLRRSPRRASCAEDGARFGMLETVRELAAERLAASGEEPRGPQPRTRAGSSPPPRRAGRIGAGASGPPGSGELERERENVRAALAWCAGEGGDAETGLRLAGSAMPYWLAHGLIAEGPRALSAALARTSRAEPSGARARWRCPPSSG